MSEREHTDIEFDFFDEPETRETDRTQRVRMPRRPGGGGPRRPVRTPQGFTPLLRLVGLIAFAILLVVLLVFWLNSCRDAGKRNSYKNYMEKVSKVGSDSAQVGRELTTVLTTPGLKQSEVPTRLLNLAQREQQDVQQAESIVAPGPLREQQQHVVEALRFRVSGLRGLADSFQQSAASKDLERSSQALAAQAQRLVTSDVVWDDLFYDPSVAELRRQGIGGVPVPDSNFVQNQELASASSWVPVLQRLRGAATGGTPSGVHGDGIVSVKALPSGTELSRSTENTIRATTDLGFEVNVQNSGGSQEVRVKVTLTIQQQNPIVRTQTIQAINPGQTIPVRFQNLGQPDFAKKLTLKVEVAKVPGETNLTNNSADYPVLFSL